MTFKLAEELGHLLNGPITILDVGSAPEGRDRWQDLVDLNMVEVYDIDGQDQEEPIFVGDGEKHIFHQTQWPGCSSILKPDPSIIDLFNHVSATREDGNFTVQATQEVETTRLDDLDLPRIDMIKLDTQGSELMILKGGGDLLKTTLMVESEVEFLPVYRDQPLFSDVDMWLRSRGFTFHRFMDLGGKTLHPLVPSTMQSGQSQLLWADAVWLTSNIRTREDAAKIAILAHYLYRSYDLTAFLLKHLREERATGVLDLYIEWFRSEGEALMELLPKRVL